MLRLILASPFVVAPAVAAASAASADKTNKANKAASADKAAGADAHWGTARGGRGDQADTADWDRDWLFGGGGGGGGGARAGGSSGSGGSSSSSSGAKADVKDPYAWKDPYGLGGRSADQYGYGGFGGSDTYGSYGSYGRGGYWDSVYDKKEPAAPEDECARLEISGVQVAETLQQVAHAIAAGTLAPASAEVRPLLDFVADVREDKLRRLLLGTCPQVVALAHLLRLGAGAEGRQQAARTLSAALAAAPALHNAYKPSPKWAGDPWELVLSGEQRRTGVVLFPNGEQQFQVDYIDPALWSIYPRRRCVGRRDLGNLQATPLSSCLEKCRANPLCRAAVFWHWQPGGFGFEQRCFLSSSCTGGIATAEGAENAVLFEKIEHATSEESERAEKEFLDHTVVTPRGGAPWAPRCGHRVVVGSPTEPGGVPTFWLFGGIGVDAFANASAPSPPAVEPAAGRGGGGLAARDRGLAASGGGTGASSKVKPSAASTKETPGKTKGKNRRKPQCNTTTSGNSAIEAYLSRHVELSGELPPLRSLPYGRLGDVWRSTDLGASWSMVVQRAPWGPRAFFGAAAVAGGRALVLLGGVRQPDAADVDANGAPGGSLPRDYMNDIWWAEVERPASWQRLASAPWEPRAGFQVATRMSHKPRSVGGLASDELVLMGGRLSSGRLVNDVWSGVVQASDPGVRWQMLTDSATWSPRSDFAAAALPPHGEEAPGELLLLGGCDAEGRALADVWRSRDGREWQQLVAAAPWGPRIGASLVALPLAPADTVAAARGQGLLMMFGGYGYPDAAYEPVPAESFEGHGGWATVVWASGDGEDWRPLSSAGISWTPNRMHTALVSAPCARGGADAGGLCAYVVGGMLNEGYYDNSVHRLVATASDLAAVATPLAGATRPHSKSASAEEPDGEAQRRQRSTLAGALMQGGLGALAIVAVIVSMGLACGWGLCGAFGGRPRQKDARTAQPVDPSVACCIAILALVLVVVACGLGCCVAVWLRLSTELELIKSEAPACRLDNSTLGSLRATLDLTELTNRWEQLQTLLRLALREPQLGYYGDSYWRGSSAAGGKGSDIYGGLGRDRYDDGYGSYGSYGGYGSLGGYGADPWAADADPASGSSGSATKSSLARELQFLPTTQALSCRSPRCERNETLCARGVPRSWASPYGCCSDYMLLMLADVTDWLDRQDIPYFITYGTLLGAVREGDILPYTQDMDIVVDRAFWPQLSRGLEAAEFFGGRHYMFAVDQWDEKVSRVCADWEGFASSIVGGADGDRLSRPTEFHLDIYANDWWQITDLHLIDCVEPLGGSRLQIRGLNFSGPARPRACVEKLYGSEWRMRKRALSGVN